MSSGGITQQNIIRIDIANAYTSLTQNLDNHTKWSSSNLSWNMSSWSTLFDRFNGGNGQV